MHDVTSQKLVRRFLAWRVFRAAQWRHRLLFACTLPRQWAGQLEIGEGVRFEAPLRCDGDGLVRLGWNVCIGYRLAPSSGDGAITLQARTRQSVIEVGDGTAMSNNATIIATSRVQIGRHCLIGDQVVIFDSDFHHAEPTLRRAADAPGGDVTLADNVWLGTRVMVLKGVTIGKNSVVAAGAVVTADIPENVIAGGVPARVIQALGQTA